MFELLHSRKFWALVTSLVSIVAGYATGAVDPWQAVQAAVAALAAYSVGTGIQAGLENAARDNG